MRGSYSARVPRSSLAEVRREFVHHIVEDEVDGEKEGQGDKREDGEEGEENGVVDEREIRHNDQMRMKHGCDGTSADPNLIHACCMQFTVKSGRVRCGVHTLRRLQQTTVSCKRHNCNKPQKS